MSTKLKWGVFLDAFWFTLFVFGLCAVVFGAVQHAENWASASFWCALSAGAVKWVVGYVRMRIKIEEE